MISGRLIPALLALLTVIMVMGVLLPGALYLYEARMPGTAWFEVHDIVVNDAVEGEIPTANIDRTVHQSVYTERHATIYRLDPARGWYHWCQRTTMRDYRTGQVLPPTQITLEFWLDIPPSPTCPDLVPGEYILTVTWLLHPEGFPDKTVRKESNVFTVVPRGEQP